MFSLRVGKPREKFPARFAPDTKLLVPSKQTIAITRLDVPKTVAPPVNATIETKKASTKARKALPAKAVRLSRVFASASSELTTDTATTSRPRMAADAPALAAKNIS